MIQSGLRASSFAALLTIALLLTLFSSTVTAQEVSAGDPELGGVDSQGKKKLTKKDPLRLEFSLRSEAYAYDNLDLLPLLEITDQDIINTDDRSTFAYSSIRAKAAYRVRRDTLVRFEASVNGLWAEDQLGSEAQRVGVLNFREASFRYTPLDTDDFSLSFKIGRQPFKIGGVPQDYMLDDILDAAVIIADANKAGRLRILAADFYTANDLPDAALVRYVGGRDQVYGFRGDNFTLRSGFVYENIGELQKGLTFKGYYFFADMGGGGITETGADVSRGGTLGNFSDNDWSAMFGGRVSYTLRFSGETSSRDKIRIYGEFAGSDGIDRKAVTERDVQVKGQAYGGGIEGRYAVSSNLSLGAEASFYHFDGSQFASDGLEFERGFVGFKGRYIGGLGIARVAGWRPSAFTGRGGFDQHPNAILRSGGTEVLYGGVWAEIAQRATLKFQLWAFTDTNSTFATPDSISNQDPPFGFSRDEFEAQLRFGKDLGTEVDVTLEYQATSSLKAFTTYSNFAPGDFYRQRIERIADTRNIASLGGPVVDFWTVAGGAEVSF